MLASAIGMTRTLRARPAGAGQADIVAGLSPSSAELALFLVVSGVGGAVFIAVRTAAAIAWFREKDVTLALGITGRAVFSAEAALALHGRH